MDKYFYILVGIIWVVSNIYKSFKKKEAGQKPSVPNDKPVTGKEKNIETILEEILTGGENVLPEKPIVQPQKPIKLKRKKKPAYSQKVLGSKTTSEVNKNNTFSYETSSYQENDVSNVVQKNTPIEEKGEEVAFDLRSAIIYSEIINKPKYLSDI